MCGIASTNPSPIFQEDKFKLNQLCLRSFVQAFKEIKPLVIFIMDYCDPQRMYSEMIEKTVPFDKVIYASWSGINATALKAYEMAKIYPDDVILFQECDYLYRPNIGKQFVEVIKEFGLVSPYDHPDFYSRFDIHPKEVELKLFNNEHFRISRRNTMTFGMTKEVFERQKDILEKYGYLDNEVWIEMAAHGNYLHTPIPAFATHMAKDYLAPSIDWKELWETLS
jgi:hypothetical protein